MNIILLSGGSGQRLWPLSNGIRSKQFIKIFHTEDGGLESMVQRVYRQIREADPEATSWEKMSVSAWSPAEETLSRRLHWRWHICRMCRE